MPHTPGTPSPHRKCLLRAGGNAAHAATTDWVLLPGGRLAKASGASAHLWQEAPMSHVVVPWLGNGTETHHYHQQPLQEVAPHPSCFQRGPQVLELVGGTDKAGQATATLPGTGPLCLPPTWTGSNHMQLSGDSPAPAAAGVSLLPSKSGTLCTPRISPAAQGEKKTLGHQDPRLAVGFREGHPSTTSHKGSSTP